MHLNANMEFTLPQRHNKLFTTIYEFNFCKKIGSGAFSKVYEAVHKLSGKKYAIKKIDLNLISYVDHKNIEKEIETHKKMNHKHIIKLYDFLMERKIVYLILEYCKGGNVFKYLNKHMNLSEIEVKRIFKQTCEGIAYMHSKNYIHRDLKPENLLIDDINNIKICDLGWACHLNENHYRKLKAGTYVYMSPESLSGKLQDEKSDIWSLGILLYELLYNKEPFSGVSCSDQLKKITRHKIDFSDRIINEEVQKLVIDILQINKEKRPEIYYILNSAYLKDNSKIFSYKLEKNQHSKKNDFIVSKTCKKISSMTFGNIQNNNKYKPYSKVFSDDNIKQTLLSSRMSQIKRDDSYFFDSQKKIIRSKIKSTYNHLITSYSMNSFDIQPNLYENEKYHKQNEENTKTKKYSYLETNHNKNNDISYTSTDYRISNLNLYSSKLDKKYIRRSTKCLSSYLVFDKSRNTSVKYNSNVSIGEQKEL